MTFLFNGVVLCIILINVCVINTQFVVPEISITALKPEGLVISIPHVPGIRRFVFNGKLNSEIVSKEAGTISGEVDEPKDNRWTIRIYDISLKKDDFISYWVFIQFKQLGYDKGTQRYEVKELLDQDPTFCIESPTTLNGKSQCGGRLIFEENFNEASLDIQKWQIEQYVPRRPDFEFNDYQNLEETLKLSDGNIHLYPTVRQNVLGENSIGSSVGCTARENLSVREQCQMNCPHFLCPPTISAQITSKVSFTYGKIEIVGRLPKGDWIYPQMYLEPHKYEYGSDDSGKIWLAFARGNEHFFVDNEDAGNNMLYVGPIFYSQKSVPKRRLDYVKKIEGQNWSSGEHNFTLVWGPETMTYFVDGLEKAVVNVPQNGFNYDGGKRPSAWKNLRAPFDKEFVLRFGVGVGGILNFPDFNKNLAKDPSIDNNKPWKNSAAQAATAFYEKENEWKLTWTSAFKINSVKVWAL